MGAGMARMKQKLVMALLAGWALIGVANEMEFLPGEWRQSLNGAWQFSTNKTLSGAVTAQVPGNWEMLPAFSTFKGTGFYRREFGVSDDWRGRRIRLKFDAVLHDSTVWLNGHELGTHVGGYTPFEFDVTDTLEYGRSIVSVIAFNLYPYDAWWKRGGMHRRNVLVVSANNLYPYGAWWKWGGISRDVTLIANHDTRIVWQHITAVPDLATGQASVSVRWKLANAGARPVQAKLVAELDGVVVPELATAITLAPQTNTFAEARFPLPRGQVRLWDFDHPNLYRLTTRMVKAGDAVHEQTDRFGIRKVEVTKDSLLLNGEPVKLVGFNRVSDSRATGNTEPDWVVRKDVDLMKRCGATMTRIMHVPQAPNLLNYVDEKGMLLIVEIPVFGRHAEIKPDNPVTQQWMREMIERDYNHPCIIGWSMGNEMEGHYEYVKSMISYTRKELDSSRILTYVSNSAYGPKASSTNEPVATADLSCNNRYPFMKGDVAATVRERWPDKPQFFTEFGECQFGAESGSIITNLNAIWASWIALHSDYVIGASLWTFNDYRSDYKNTPASGNREWGVVDEQRRPKAAYEQARRLFSPVRSLTVTNGQVRLEPRAVGEIPCYRLRDYKIIWTRGDQRGEIDLPVIEPGSAVWSTPLPVKESGVHVELVTPTGYTVQEWGNIPATPAYGAETSASGKASELDLGAMIQPVPMSARFSEPGYFVWCGAPVKGDDGRYHLYYSRWPIEKGFFPSWAIWSEIAYAVADKPLGPYKHVNVVLPHRGRQFWDGTTTHNPNILRKNGKYYLFYMGNTGDGQSYPMHRNNQRVGVAVADRPEGPWRRFDKPILDVSDDKDAFDSLCVTNPSATERPDGGILLIYKGVRIDAGKVMGGQVRHGAALADTPEGPYTKVSGRIFEADDADSGNHWMLAEDPFIWFSRRYGNRYYAVARDAVGKFSGSKDGIALFESLDGLHWKSVSHPKVLGSRYRWADGSMSVARLERPVILFDDETPVALFGAADGYEVEGRISSNIQFPLQKQP